MKKAQGISVNVIIIAAIALLVLVVLSVIFIGRMGNWGTNAADCKNKGGTCASGTTCPSGQTQYSGFECTGTDKGKICCININAGP
jgi:hypothetical protein